MTRADTAAHLTLPNAPHGALASLPARTLALAFAAADWLARARCGLRGHATVPHFEPHRLSLKCMHCGEQSAGWTMKGGRV